MTRLDRSEVATGFDRAARRYDLMVGLNPGYHRHLGTAVAALLEAAGPRAGHRPLRLVDLGCGSGASTRALVRELDRRGLAAEVVGLDASAGMVERARRKSWPAGVRFVRAPAEDVGACLPEGWADGVLAAYLFRNVEDRDAVLRQVYDLLRPGGVLVAEEYSVAGSVAARRRWTAVCRLVVQPLSVAVSGHPELYRYLWRSVIDFEPVADFATRLIRTGYGDVRHRTVSGWQRDILHVIRGRRPRARGTADDHES